MARLGFGYPGLLVTIDYTDTQPEFQMIFFSYLYDMIEFHDACVCGLGLVVVRFRVMFQLM